MNKNIKYKEVCDMLAHKMQGHNFQTSFGILMFEHCSYLDCLKILELLGLTKLSNDPNAIIVVDEKAFWDEIESSLSFHGDEHEGLLLNENEILKLNEIQGQYKKLLKTLITPASLLYSFCKDEWFGNYYYPVHWGYRFVIVNNDNNCIFVYGAASD